MRLKRLILHGFKSFADRTEFVFDSPITGIVGPNGCGKSNVVDAFKWVLGEQSAKSLRGDAMLDVIFNGAAGRKPAGMSEVVLCFDNPKREDGARTLNVDADEVTVGRRLFRDGTSEYQLNSQATRLKDVRELFLDTGVGVDAYSVIEQGRVSQLLESNPQERRLIFEEAAGISKYKVKKKEAQRKLERVDQNLLRVRDIVEEVEKRLRSVRIQAGRARTYQEHSQRLRELRLNYALQEYHTLFSQHGEVEAGQKQAEESLALVSGEMEAKQAELASQRQEFEALNKRKQESEYELVQARAAVGSARQQQQYAQQQILQAAEQMAQFEQDRESLASKSEEVAASLEQETQTLARLTEELSEQRRQIEELQVAFADGQVELNEANRQVERHKAAILDLMRQVSNVNNRLGAIEIERKNIASQQTRLTDRRDVVLGEIQGLEAARVELDVIAQTAGSEIAGLSSAVNQSNREAAALGMHIKELAEHLGSAREHRSGLLSRRKLLEDLEANREGVSEGVKAILRHREERFPFIRGLVADMLRVDVEHAQVIEAALDGRDQSLVADDSAHVAAAREALEELEGRVNIICMSDLPAFDDGHDWNTHRIRIRRAVDLVRFAIGDTTLANHLLGKTIVTDDLGQAMELAHVGPAGYRYVTHAGEVVEADATIRVGPLTASMGLLSRRSELEQLTKQVGDVDQRIGQLDGQVNEGNAQARALQEKLSALRDAIHHANTKKVEIASRLAQNADKQSALRREEPLLDRELANLAEQLGRLATEEATLTEKHQALEADQNSRQNQIDELTRQQAELNERLRMTGEQLTAARVALGQAQEKQLSSQQTVRRLEASRAELAQQLERVMRSAEALMARRENLERELETAQAAEAEQTQRVEYQTAAVAEMVEQVGQMRTTVEALATDVDAVSERYNEITASLHQFQVQIGELRVRLEGLVQRTADELQLDLPGKYAELAQTGGYQPSDTDWEAVAGEIKELRDKIQRLGNVNLDAINELDELETREKFLTMQVADLVTSKQQLEQFIEQINVESGLRFEQTFNAVREHFQGMFRKLFGGGKADIFLETEIQVKAPPGEVGPDGTPAPAMITKKVDVLDAGIEVIARPPGKQPVSITQLSGGEKTMTCVALLMSIFKSKPSPFCILDEVDAALDEANNQRFNLIVQEFLEQSQFIIITHSKRTMQIADVLYGVTMQEQGVSKRVAVKFDQVASDGRITEQAAA